MRGRIVEITDDVRLHRASENNLEERVKTLSRKVRARATREEATVACVFVHEDFDRPDGPDYVTAQNRVQAALERNLGTAHYVLAVAEVESWMLLFPHALSAVTSAWKVPGKYRNKDTGRLADPKRVLTSEVCKSGRRYRESDAPVIFERVVASRSYDSPSGSNRSWRRLRDDAATCCASHLRTGR